MWKACWVKSCDRAIRNDRRQKNGFAGSVEAYIQYLFCRFNKCVVENSHLSTMFFGLHKWNLKKVPRIRKKKLYWTMSGILWGKFLITKSRTNNRHLICKEQVVEHQAQALWPRISQVSPCLETGSAISHAEWQRESRSVSTPVSDEYRGVNIHAPAVHTMWRENFVVWTAQVPRRLGKLCRRAPALAIRTQLAD